MSGLLLVVILFSSLVSGTDYELCKKCMCDFGSKALTCESFVAWDTADEGGQISNPDFRRLTYNPPECFLDFKPERYFPNLQQFSTTCCDNLITTQKYQTTCQLKPDFNNKNNDNDNNNGSLGWIFYTTSILGTIALISCLLYFFKCAKQQQQPPPINVPQMIELSIMGLPHPPRPPAPVFRNEVLIDLQ